MLKRKVWKGLLGLSAVAALFGALAAHAQSTTGQTGSATSGTRSTTEQSATGQAGTSGQGASAQGSTASGAAAATALSKADQILADMARANLAEIEMGKLAQSKSQDEQVKNFAQQMIDDHTKALNDVQQLAQAKGVTLPTEPDSKHKKMADKLGKMSGDAFNRTYMAQAGVSDHKKVHSMLQKTESRAKDPDLKALAAKMRPTVEQHLNSAEQMKVGAAKGAPDEKATTGKTQ
ncbi:MAG: DUF4142 domain-containing protein [Telluria sp.]